MKIKVLRDLVAIKEIEEKQETKNGIHIAGKDKNAPMKGTVIAVGPGTYDKKGNRKVPPFSEGEMVLFSRGTGQKIELTLDTQVLVLKPDDILAKMK